MKEENIIIKQEKFPLKEEKNYKKRKNCNKTKVKLQ